MSIASTITYETSLRVDTFGDFLDINVGTDFFINPDDSDKDYDQILNTALHNRLGRRTGGSLHKKFQSFEIAHRPDLYFVNITILVSWVQVVNGQRINHTRALALESSGNNAREVMRDVVLLRRDEVWRQFNRALGDAAPPAYATTLTEWYLTEFLGNKRPPQKKA